MRKNFENSVQPVDENFGQDRIYSLSIEKIQQELNWKPTVTLSEGIDEVIKWVDLNWDIIKSLPLDYIHKP